MNNLVKNIVMQPDLGMLMGKSIPSDRVLIIAPHCDDESIGFGGNIIKYIKKGSEIKIVFLTSDEKRLREDEACKAWNLYENVLLEFFRLPDSYAYQYLGSTIPKLRRIISDFRPELIALPWFLDKHNDHLFSNVLLKNTFEKYSKDMFAFVKHVVNYEVNFPLYINYAVNITEVYEEKIKLISNYVSQKPEHYIKITNYLNQYRAEQIGWKKVKFAEALYVSSVEEFCSLIKEYVQEP